MVLGGRPEGSQTPRPYAPERMTIAVATSTPQVVADAVVHNICFICINAYRGAGGHAARLIIDDLATWGPTPGERRGGS